MLDNFSKQDFPPAVGLSAYHKKAGEIQVSFCFSFPCVAALSGRVGC